MFSIESILKVLFIASLLSCADFVIAGDGKVSGCQFNTLIDASKNILIEADRKVQSGLYAEASALLKKGLNAIGDSYYSKGLIDDTDMKLVLADSEDKRGLSVRAFNLRRNVLENRLNLVVEKNANCK